MDDALLKRLCETPGVPSREDRLRDIVREILGPLVDEVSTDVMGNVIGLKRGKGHCKVMVAAHMDEIGFLVKHIDKKGFLRLQSLGGFDPRQLFAQRVIVQTAGGESLRGVLSYTTKPTHMLTDEERNRPPRIENFFVDLALGPDAVKEKVAVGDMVTMDRTCEACGQGFISKSLDNRVGLFVMLEAMRALQGYEADIYAVATAQEEIGLRGATTAAYAITPDVGVALDTTLANDFPGMSEQDAVTQLGEGVAIKIMDSSLVCHPKLVAHMRQIAEAHSIKHQMEILPRGGTDAGALQLSRGGAASITLSVPTRYIHTVNELVYQDDVECAISLLSEYLAVAHEGRYKY